METGGLILAIFFYFFFRFVFQWLDRLLIVGLISGGLSKAKTKISNLIGDDGA